MSMRLVLHTITTNGGGLRSAPNRSRTEVRLGGSPPPGEGPPNVRAPSIYWRGMACSCSRPGFVVRELRIGGQHRRSYPRAGGMDMFPVGGAGPAPKSSGDGITADRC